MKENQVSFTAMMTAYMRSYHAMYITPKIFDDFLAYSLIPEERRILIEQNIPEASRINRLKNTNIISRARYAEDALEKAVKQGIKQYVILGAGLDTFAFRRPEMMGKLEVFEIDHPATQEFKLFRIAELGWKYPAKLHFIPTDFTKESLEIVLTHSPSFDTKAKTFFSWLGVTMYLTRNEVFDTLRSIINIAPPGSIIVFDYLDLDAFNPEKSTKIQRRLKFLRDISEPMITGFDPSTLADDLANLGLNLCENLDSTDIERLYFQDYKNEYHAAKHGHFAYAIIK
jgi:methyltransferase (TIGR00027 family)